MAADHNFVHAGAHFGNRKLAVGTAARHGDGFSLVADFNDRAGQRSAGCGNRALQNTILRQLHVCEPDGVLGDHLTDQHTEDDGRLPHNSMGLVSEHS